MESLVDGVAGVSGLVAGLLRARPVGGIVEAESRLAWSVWACSALPTFLRSQTRSVTCRSRCEDLRAAKRLFEVLEIFPLACFSHLMTAGTAVTKFQLAHVAELSAWERHR